MEPWIAIVGVSIGTGLVWLILWIGSVREHKSAASETFKEIKNTLGRLERIMGSILLRVRGGTTEGGSPLQLTDLGKSISEDLDTKEWAKAIVPSLQDQVKGMLPFELQDWCLSYVKNEFQPTASQTLRLNMAAYNNALDLDAVLDVLALEMRDLMLELFEIPNTDPEQLDTPADT